MNLTLADCKKIKSAKIYNEQFWKIKFCNNVSTDSRSVKKNGLFFAIKGENFDAHSFIFEIIKKKVIGCVVNYNWYKNNIDKCKNLNTTFIAVDDTTTAFGNLANIYRNKFSIPMIAIGGSNGKTTTKEMIKEVLKTKYNVLATEGNLNNHIGLPQMIYKLNSKTEIAVFELGTNHPGELKYLCNILEPTDGVLTNIGKEHLEYFKNLDGVMLEERTILKSVKKDGFKFINNDDERIKKFSSGMKNKITIGSDLNSDFNISNVKINKNGNCNYKITQSKSGKNENVKLKISGLHNVNNSAIAVVIGKTFGIPMRKSTIALKKFNPPSKRMEVLKINGFTIINDCYNANPDSMLAAFKTLEKIKTSGRKIIVLGDMFELGKTAIIEHKKIGIELNKSEMQYIFTIGSLMKHCNLKLKNKNSLHFENKNELAKYLKNFISKNDVVLIKGSRGMKMEEIIVELKSKGK